MSIRSSLFALAASLWLCLPAHADGIGQQYPAAGQLPGTATNDNASAGNVGEVIASVGRATNATVTISNASPAVISDSAACTATQTSGCVGTGNVVNFTTSGGLPTGLSTGTNYYVLATGFTAGVSYQVATTPFGTAINTSSAGSGTQTRVNTTTGCGNNANCTVAAVQLTAGDWRCTASGESTFSGNSTATKLFIGTTNNSATGQIVESISYEQYPSGAFPDFIRGTPVVRILQSGTTTYYFEAFGTFSTGVLSSAGTVLCWRAR